MTAFAFDKDQMPLGIKLLPRDKRGYVIPWFVDRNAPPKDGGPDFRIMDGKRLKQAIREKRCWVCGLRIRDEESSAFVSGPMCGIERISSEPPSHEECARWSVRACPFLSQPKRIRDDSGLDKTQVAMAGIGLEHNPGVSLVWVCDGYDEIKYDGAEGGNPGTLLALHEPSTVEFWTQGRMATTAEVVDALQLAIPKLGDRCKEMKNPVRELFELGRRFERFLQYVPRDGTV